MPTSLPQPAGARIAVLDAVLGIAALPVLFSHCYATLPDATRAAFSLRERPAGPLTGCAPARRPALAI